MGKLLLGIVVVAAVATAGDYIWYEVGVGNRMTTGIIHGAVLLTAVGGVLGALGGRFLTGLPLGAIAGVAGALVYYAAATAVGGIAAMVIAWAALWIVLAVFDGRILRRVKLPPPEIVSRGVLAAVLGAVAFYAMLNVLWGRPPAGGRNYALQFAAWMIAWAPGIMALAADLPGRPKRAQ
jgi:hypothetical protein